MKAINMKDVKEAGDFTRPDPGAYICTITGAEEFESKEYLKITYDIAEGEFKGYYSTMRENNPTWEWAGAYCKSYKPAALPMFKRFCSAVSHSNGSFIFDGGEVNHDEKTLIGKKVGLLLGEEEYYGNDGEKKTRLYVNREFSVDKLKDQKVPKLKTLKEETTSSAPDDGFVNVPADTPEETPFN